MKIIIRDEDENKGFKLFLPLSMIKLKIIWKSVYKYDDDKANLILSIVKEAYKELKVYIKNNGHFVFVDVKTSDGSRVLIKV